MNAVVTLFGLAVFALGALGALRPATLLASVEHAWRHPLGPHVAFAWRAGLGVALLLGSESLRLPTALALLGALSLVSAVVVTLLGRERMLGVTAWWRARPALFVRAASLLACAFGAGLVWSAAPA